MHLCSLAWRFFAPRPERKTPLIRSSCAPLLSRLLGPVQAEFFQPNSDSDAARVNRDRASQGKDCHLPSRKAILVKPLQNPALRSRLAAVDLAQREHRTTLCSATASPPILHDHSISVLVVVLIS